MLAVSCATTTPCTRWLWIVSCHIGDMFARLHPVDGESLEGAYVCHADVHNADVHNKPLHSSGVERQSRKLNVLGSSRSGG